MKSKIILFLIALTLGVQQSKAQHIRVQLGYPTGISIGAPGPAPYAGGIWIGPEWVWRGGRYECVPGYWARPRRHGAIWITGHWQGGRRGYRWVPGHWR